MIKINPERKKLIFAIIGTLLMFSGIYGMFMYIPASPSSLNENPFPALASTGLHASTSIAVSGFTQSNVVNSSTTSLTLNSIRNTTQQSSSINSGSSYTLNSAGTSATTTISSSYQVYITCYAKAVGTTAGGKAIFYKIYSLNTTQLYSLFLDNGVDSASKYIIGTVFANLSLNEKTRLTLSWSHSFNVQSSTDTYTEISPSWTNANVTGIVSSSGYFTVGVTVNVTSDAGTTFSVAPAALKTFSGSSTDNALSSTEPTQALIPFITGWTYAGQSVSNTFTIPQYEHAYDVTWTTTQVGDALYNSITQTSPSSFIGSMKVNTISFNASTYDPNVPSYLFSYNLTSQIQVAHAYTNETNSISYSYTEVAGTTNENASSFSFSGITPAAQVFTTYETTANSLTVSNTNISFLPTVTVANPYYACTQNQLVAQMSGSTTGLSTTTGIGKVTFSGGSITYASSASPSWSVSLNIYGNTAPSIGTPAILFTGSGSQAQVTFTSSQSVFNTETQTYVIYWGDGTTSTESGLLAGTHTFTHIYINTFSNAFSQKYTIYVTDTNNPSPPTNGLSSIKATSSTTSYTIASQNKIIPAYYSSIQVGQHLYFNWTVNNWLVSSLIATINGQIQPLITNTIGAYSGSASIQNPYESPTTVVWVLQGGSISDQVSVVYSSVITPTEYAPYLSAGYSHGTTKSYPFTLTGTPSGTGYYQQLLTIGNASKSISNYGINKQGSNIQFTAGNGTLLYAWIQNINTTTITVWVKNFNQSTVIEMQVFPEFENHFSATGYLGEAPQLSSVYAEYDNGKKVFNFYDNFKGTTLSYSWTVPAGSNYSVNNGFIGEPSGGSTTAVYDPNLRETSSIITEWGINLSSTTYPGTASNFQLNRYTEYSNMHWLGIQGSDTPANNVSTYPTQAIADSGFQTFGIWNDGTTVNWLYNGAILYSNTSAVAETDYLALGWAYNGQSHDFPTINWVRTRDYLPVMPTFTIGAGSIFQANITSITQVPQFTTQEDPSNGSLEYVIYQIPSGNYPYVNIYYNSTWTFFSANFNATASPSVQTNYNTIFLNTVTFNPFAITFIQPIPIKKTNTISVTQVRGLTTLTPSTSQVQYTFSLQLNGGNLQYGLINNTASSGTFQIFNASTGLLYGDGFLSNQLYNQSAMAVNFTADLQGTYYYVLSSTPTYKGSQYSLQYTGKFNVTSSLKFTNGLHPTLTGVTSITQNTNNSYKLTIAYNNGTLINGSDSVKVLKNLSIQLQQSTTLIATLKANEISNGTFIIYLDEATAGNYFIVVTISPTLIGSLTASAQTDIAITVNPVALNVITVTQVKGISPLKPSSSLVQYNFSLRLNGQPLSSGLLNYTTSLTTFQVFNATSGLLYANGFVSDPLYSTSSITVNFTMNMQGSFIYTLSATSLSYDNSAYFLQYSGKINVTASLKYTNGLKPALAGVPSIVQNTNNTYRLSVTYNNGTLINASNTLSVARNLSVLLIYSTSTIQTLTAYKVSNGTFVIYLNVSKPDNYFLVASISQTIIGTKTASGQTDLAINVTNTPVKINRGIILTLSEPSGTLLANVPYTYTATLEYFNGSTMNKADTELSINRMNITVYSYSKVIEYGNGTYLHNGMAGFNLSLNAGSYFILVTIGNETINGQNVSASHSLNILIVKEAGSGMTFHVVSPSSAQATVPFVVSVTLSMNNGINLTFLNTVGIAKYLIVNVYYNSTIQLISPFYSSSTLAPGQIALTFNYTKIGTYTIEVSFNGTIDNIQASGKGSTQTVIVNYNPQQSAWQNFWSSFYASPLGQFITSFGEEIAIAVIMAIAGSIIVRLRRSGEARALQESRAQDSVLNTAIEKITNATTVAFKTSGLYEIYKAMNYAERDAFMTIHDKYLKHVYLKLDDRRTSLKKARDMLKKEIEGKKGYYYQELKEMEGIHL